MSMAERPTPEPTPPSPAAGTDRWHAAQRLGGAQFADWVIANPERHPDDLKLLWAWFCNDPAPAEGTCPCTECGHHDEYAIPRPLRQTTVACRRCGHPVPAEQRVQLKIVDEDSDHPFAQMHVDHRLSSHDLWDLLTLYRLQFLEDTRNPLLGDPPPSDHALHRWIHDRLIAEGREFIWEVSEHQDEEHMAEPRRWARTTLRRLWPTLAQELDRCEAELDQ